MRLTDTLAIILMVLVLAIFAFKQIEKAINRTTVRTAEQIRTVSYRGE